MSSKMTPLEEYGRLRRTTKEIIANLQAVAKELDLSRDGKSLGGLSKRVDEGLLRIIVIGEFNRGKSTFINALLGRNVLPMAVRPTTATLNIIQWGEEPKTVATFTDESTEEVELEKLEEYVTVKGEHVPRVKYVELFYPTPFCERGVRLIDTPGVNDLDKQREEITYGFIPGSDAAILVLDSEAAISRSEKIFLEEKILKNDISKIFLVLNKIDQLDPADLEEVITYAKGKLKDIVGESRLFPLSAKQAMKAKEADDEALLMKSGMPDFERALGDFLVKDRGRVVLLVPVGRAQRIGKRLLTAAALRRESLSMDLAEFEEKSKKLEPILDEHDKVKSSVDQRMSKAADELARQFEAKVREGMLELKKDMDAVVDESAIEADFVKEILPDLLRKKISDMLEDNQKVISERLGELEKRAITDVSRVLEKLDSVVLEEFSFSKQKEFVNELRLRKSKESKEEMYYEVGSLVAGGAISLVGVMVMGVFGLIPAFFGAKYVKDLIEERHQDSLRKELKKTLGKLLGEMEGQLVTDTKKNICDIATQIKEQLGRQVEESSESVRKTLQQMKEDHREAEASAQERDSKLAALEERVTKELRSLRELEESLR